MKKNIILTMVFMLVTLVSQAQTFFEQFEKYDDVEYVYISKSLLGLIDNVESAGVNLKGISEKLDNVIIISMDKPVVVKGHQDNPDQYMPVCVRTAHKTPVYLHNTGYEQLMRAKDKDELTMIYVKGKSKSNKEIVIYNEEKEEISIVVIKGRLTADDIKKISKM